MGKKRSLIQNIFITLIIFFFLSSCCPIFISSSEKEKRDYGLLLSAVTFSSDKVIGEYGDEIPDDFTVDDFMNLVKDKIPDDYYDTLKTNQLSIEPKGSYYLLVVKRPKDNSIILFDYSCTPEADGPVLNEPYKYDLNNLELYDTCK